jgi:hypothetical protein
MEFKNIKKLLSGGEDLPARNDEFIDDYYGPALDSDDTDRENSDKAFPQYSNFVSNANQQVLTDKANEYVFGGAKDIIDRPIPFSPAHGDRSETNALDNVVLSSDPSDETKQFMTDLHNISTYKTAKRPYTDLNVKGDALDYNRSDINQKIVDAYVKDLHPEWHQNMKTSKADKHSPPREHKEMLNYGKQIAKEVLGDLPETDVAHSPGYFKGTTAAGDYNSEKNKIRVADASDIQTLVHEMQHARDNKESPDRRVRSESLPDLKNESHIAKALHTGNRGHINSYLDEQKDIPERSSAYFAREPVGESAPWFNLLRKLIHKQSK